MKKYDDTAFFISELISGSDEAWAYFLKYYGRLVYFIINDVIHRVHYNASQEDKEDCYQNILKILIENNYRILRNIRFPQEMAFRAYLVAITRRRTMNFLRDKLKLQDRRVSGDISDTLIDLIPDQSSSLDRDTLIVEINDIIKQKLDSRERLILGYVMEGLTLIEIAELMTCNHKIVHKIKQRAIGKVKYYIEGRKNPLCGDLLLKQGNEI